MIEQGVDLKEHIWQNTFANMAKKAVVLKIRVNYMTNSFFVLYLACAGRLL